MTEREPGNHEKYKSDVIENVGKILADTPWIRRGHLFLGSGTISQHRDLSYSYGPRFSESITTRLILGINREHAHTIKIESPEGQDSEGFAAVTTSYSIDMDTQEITVSQRFGDYARNRFHDEEWAKENSSVYGIDKEPEEAQWQAIAKLTAEWVPKPGQT